MRIRERVRIFLGLACFVSGCITAAMENIVTTDWLAQHLSDPDLRILDGSWYMPADARDTAAEFTQCHISTAQFFDIDAVSDQASDLPHMVPTKADFEIAVRAMGINSNSKIVVYDTAGLFSAARVWWLFRTMGHTDVAVLNGGLPKWLAEGRAVSENAETPKPGNFTARLNAAAIVSAEQVSDSSAQVIDARAAPRFAGAVPEPRAGLRSGHIPGSLNVFFKDVLMPDGQLKSANDLRSVFERAGVNISAPIITTCGSGVTAAVLDLALSIIGSDQKQLYDGSWSDWGARTDLPIETG